MAQNTNKEWERRKWYLVRSLFDNEPLLSPIPETQETSLSPTEGALSGPYSPLPDLIIEKEPNRHDEPEEYYHELEKIIKKVYKRLFLRKETFEDSSADDMQEIILMHRTNMVTEAVEETIQSEHSSIERRQSGENSSLDETNVSDEQISESTNPSSDNHSGSKDSNSSTSVEDSKSSKRTDSSSIEDLSVNEPINSLTDHSETNSNSSVKSTYERNEESKLSEKRVSTPLEENDTSSTSSMKISQTIVTKAQIHDTGRKQSADTISHIDPASPLDVVTSRDDRSEILDALSDKKDQSKSTVIITRYTEVSETEYEQSESELGSLQSSCSQEVLERAISGVHSDPNSLDEPEMMRRRDTINISLQSAFNERRDSSIGFEPVEHSAREMEEAEGLSLISGASTPKLQEQRYSKRRIFSEICAKPTKRTKQNLATQTSTSMTADSLSDDENNWQEIRTSFFEGSPRIYKFCTCSNHVCR